MVYDFYPTRCVFSIPSPRLGDRKHTTRWIKIIYHRKTLDSLEILYIIRFQRILLKLNVNIASVAAQHIRYQTSTTLRSKKKKFLEDL